MAVEIGNAYVAISAETSKIAPAVSSAFNGPVSQAASSAGPSIGSRLASGIGTTLKAGAVTVGAAAGVALGSALSKGLDRLTAIDNAQAKLKGLGNSAQDVSVIMGNALASVKGTAFGLGEAASVAASAVAAGIQPGQDLERTLKLVADAATIAGTDMGEMGAIFNKVAASGKLMGDDIAQLQDHGIPIVSLLAKQLHLTGEEVYDLASKGKINFQQFQDAIESGMGGAALTAADTFSGSLKNVGAALGRFGAALLAPGFSSAPGLFRGITAAIDEMTPKAAQLSQEFGQKAAQGFQEFGAAASKAFEKIQGSDLFQESLSRVRAVIEQLVDVAQEAGPAIGKIGSSLAQASGALGVSAWELFLSALEAATGVLQALTPALSGLANLMHDHQTVVTAAALAWAAFKTVPALLGNVSTAAGGLQSKLAPVTEKLRGFGEQMQVQARLAEASGQSISRFGAAVATLQARSATLTNMSTAFTTTAASASRFGSTISAMAGTASAAMSGLRSAASGLVNVMGGPWGAALAGAGLALAALASNSQNTSAQLNAISNLSKTAADSARDLADAFAKTGGVVNSVSFDAIVDSIDKVKQSFADVGATAPGKMDTVGAALGGVGNAAKALGVSVFNVKGAFDALKGPFDEIVNKTDNAEKFQKMTDEINNLGLSSQELAQKMTASSSGFAQWVGQLRSSGQISEDTAQALLQMRDSINQTADAMRRLGPGGAQINEGLSQIAGSAGNAQEALGGLRSVLQGLGLIQADALDSMAQLNQKVLDIGQSAGVAGGGVNQFAGATLDAAGKIDTTTQSGINLQNSLKDIGTGFMTAVAAGNSTDEAMAAASRGLQALSDATGIPIEKLKELAGQFGLLPKQVTIGMSITGRDAVAQDIAEVKLGLDNLQPGVPRTLTVQLQGGQAAVDTLTRLGFKVTDYDGKTGTATVTAQGDAETKLDTVIQKLNEVDAKTPTADLVLEDGTFNQKLADANKKLDDTGNKTAKPTVDVNDNATGTLDSISGKLDSLDGRNVTSTVTTNYVTTGTPPGGKWRGGVAGRWRGGITPKVPAAASGFRLPLSGPGSEVTDGFLGVTATGMPIVRVNAGEWVVNDESSRLYDAAIAALNAKNPRAAIAALMDKVGVTTAGSFSTHGVSGSYDLAAGTASVSLSIGNFVTQNLPEGIRQLEAMQRRAARRYKRPGR